MASRTITSLFWRSHRIYQIFGANTDVGKTIFTTLLCKAARKIWPQETVTFLKPVSTGPDDEADDRHLKTFAPGVSTAVLFKYGIPVSPHLAAQASEQSLPTDNYLLAKCQEFATDLARQNNEKGWLFLETAGGVHSPTPSGTTQADLYTPLRVPVVLVGDSRLGGISQTVSAFESLHVRGYDVQSVLLFEDDKYGNLDYLTGYFRDRYEDVLVAGVAEPPARHASPQQDLEAMTQYYTTYGTEGSTAKTVLERLDRRHGERVASLESMASRAHRSIWWPFTQQSLLQPEKITVIDSAHGDYFQTLVPQTTTTTTTGNNNQSPPAADRPEPPPQALLRSSFDGSASWWTQGLGHGNPRLTLAAAHAAGRYGHVMFAEAVHKPALELAEALLRGVGNPRLRRVFFSDNGSTGTEVAIKMALRATRLRYYHEHEHQHDEAPREMAAGSGGGGGGRSRDVLGEEEEKEKKKKLGVIGLKGGYHGDTIGAMDSAEPCAYNEKTEWYQGRGYWFDYPTVLCVGGTWRTVVPGALEGPFGRGQVFASLRDVFDVAAREARDEHLAYEAYIQKTLEDLRDEGQRFGAVILEPVVLGAGGMALVDPLFQRALVNVVRRSPSLFQGTTTNSPDAAGHEEDPHAWRGLPVIFDEVFTGIYRLGRFTAASFLGAHPDVSVHAKLLTGGLVPLCTTLASEGVFAAFGRSRDKTDALLHGHSYTAHPVGCQVAVESLRQMAALDRGGGWDWAKRGGGWVVVDDDDDDDLGSRSSRSRSDGTKPASLAAEARGREAATGQHARAHEHALEVWSVWPLDLVDGLSRQTGRVMGVWALGSVLAIHLRDRDAGYVSNAAASLRNALLDGTESWNVHCRVLGNVLYLMAGQTTTKASVDDIGRLLRQKLT